MFHCAAPAAILAPCSSGRPEAQHRARRRVGAPVFPAQSGQRFLDRARRLAGAERPGPTAARRQGDLVPLDCTQEVERNARHIPAQLVDRASPGAAGRPGLQTVDVSTAGMRSPTGVRSSTPTRRRAGATAQISSMEDAWTPHRLYSVGRAPSCGALRRRIQTDSRKCV